MSKINRKDKWRNISLNDSNIDEYISDMITETKGNYITQGVSFAKGDSYQMGMLRQVLLNHSSFSGLVKHLLTLYFSGQPIQPMQHNPMIAQQHVMFPSNAIRDYVQPERTDVPKQNVPPSYSNPPVVNTSESVSRKSRTVDSPTSRVSGGGSFLRTNPNAKLPND